MATSTAALPVPAPNLRPFNLGRDLTEVADLIELCFAETLDRDGQRYLSQMRSAARSSSFLRWASRVSESVSLPLSGYVWEESGHVVGNLSLIPFNTGFRRIYLIANVAVHPDHRRKGIARSLTQAALTSLQRRGEEYPWLQVRADNPGAQELYASLGFRERACRTTWHSLPGLPGLETSPGTVITARQRNHWTQQRRWFQQAYPDEILWHFQITADLLDPGLRGWFQRFANTSLIAQWAALHHGELAGVLAWQSTNAYTDSLWLCADEGQEEAAIRSLLPYAIARKGNRRPLALDYPAGRADEAIRAAGFIPHVTLVWMQAAHWS